MTLLLRTVVVAILVVSTTATPPPGYVKQPDEDKNPPSYRYKYEVQDKAGDGHGKAEAREGEHAAGRYYVNSKRSSTDVKYVADEWGYHPLVKYGSSNDYSSASASFAIGEKAVKSLQNENIGFPTLNILQKNDRRKLIQVIQPYRAVQQIVGANSVYNLNNNESTFTSPKVVLHSNENLGSANALNINYNTNAPEQQIAETVSPSSNDVFLATGHQSSALQQQSRITSSLSNDLTSPVSEEDQLIVQNAGSFGQRLHGQNDDAAAYSTTTTTASTISTHNDILSSSSTTRDGRYFRGRARQKNGKTYLPDTIPGLGAYSSTTFSPLDNSVTVNSIESESGSVQDHENNRVVEGAALQTYSTLGGNIGSSISMTTPNPLLINYASRGVLSSIPKTTDITAYEKKEQGPFSKPIVVPEVQKERPFQYSTTFECEDDDGSSNTPNPIASIKNSFGDITSSHILNPIQAGVALVNAGETHLIGTAATPLNEKLPAPVKEQIEELSQADQAAAQLTNTIVTQGTNYVGINPAFGGPEEEKQRTQTASSKSDQTVEIQKSIEIYQSSSGQELHYPNQQVVSQRTHIEQQPQAQTFESQQRQYYVTDIDSNSKQVSSQAGGDALTKVYEITNNYPKELSADQPVYVVPPATYVVDDGSVLKNSLLQEKVQQYQTNILGADTKTKPVEQQIYTETQNGAPQQSYQFSDLGISYNTETLQEQHQNISAQPEVKIEAILEKTVHVPHAYTVEKIIEKKVPYPVEKIIEKKIPIPHPYPVPVQVPVPQPFPVHIEKVVERKVPIPVHIHVPHPYPVEKPIHIPVPIEKIVEKPVHIPITVEKIIEKKVPVPQPYPVEVEKIVERKIPYPIEVTKYIEKPVTLHAPYGVQYGVSYQQIMKLQNHGLYSHQSNNLASLYALSVSANNNLYNNNNLNNVNKNINDINVNNLNHNQTFQGYVYDKPSIPFIEEKESPKSTTKKIVYNSYTLPNYPLSNALLHRRHTAIHRPGKHERDDYLGPVPPLHHIQRQYGFPTKTFASYASLTDRTQNSRKSRNHEPVRYQKGNFRQSKIEYGFKPPIVPSVQYDEETASKVES